MPQQKYIDQASQQMPPPETPQGQPPESSTQAPDTQNAPEIPDLVKQATYDIFSGADPKDVEKTYPELANNMDVFYSLAATMQKRPVHEIPALYPELFTPEQISTIGKQYQPISQDQHAGE